MLRISMGMNMNYTLNSLLDRPYIAVDKQIAASLDWLAGSYSFFTPVNLTMILVLTLFTAALLLLLMKRASE